MDEEKKMEAPSPPQRLMLGDLVVAEYARAGLRVRSIEPTGVGFSVTFDDDASADEATDVSHLDK
jgi:hypothetical protein